MGAAAANPFNQQRCSLQCMLWFLYVLSVTALLRPLLERTSIFCICNIDVAYIHTVIPAVDAAAAGPVGQQMYSL